jgi:hypothetical protein
MKLVHAEDVIAEPAVRHRGGGLRARILLEGAPGTPGNFQLSLGETGADFLSPRHRHNFEQYRVVLKGEYDFGRDGVMTEGMIGYFPAGVHYGPQTSGERTLAAVLQFGGASGAGYLSAGEVAAGMKALERLGEFRNGIFRRNEGVPGRRNQDAFEAIWEFVNARHLDYAASPYAAPALIDPDDVEWMPLDGAGRVAEKPLGRFPAHETAMRALALGEGARFEARGRSVILFLSGAGTVAGRPFHELTACHLEAGETAEVAADTASRLLEFELPSFS